MKKQVYQISASSLPMIMNFQDGLKLMLSKHPEIRIVAEAENGGSLGINPEHKPEVVLMI